MFGENYTLQDWINARDLYLIACDSDDLPENLLFAYSARAKTANLKVREVMKDIMDLERAFSLPSNTGNDNFKR